MYVTYNPTNAVDGYLVGDYKYTFKNTDVQAYQAARVLLNILFGVSIVIAVLYYRALKTTYGDVRAFALPEQRWQLFYMFAVIIFQNPFYCVIMWIEDPPVSVTYVTYVLGRRHIYDTLSHYCYFISCLSLCLINGININISLCLLYLCINVIMPELQMQLHRLRFSLYGYSFLMVFAAISTTGCSMCPRC